MSLGVVVITLIMALVAIMFLRQENIVTTAKFWVLHSHEVVENTEALSSKIKDAVLYERNYLISGDSGFLDSYHALVGGGVVKISEQSFNVPSIDDDIGRLKNLTADNQIQQRNVALLLTQTGELRSYLDDMIRLEQQNDPAASSIDNAMRGKKLLDHVRAAIDTILAEETRLLGERTKIDENNSQRNTIFVLIAIALFYIIKLLLSWMVYRQWQQTKNMEQQHQLRAMEVIEANSHLQKAYQELEAMAAQISESGQARLRAVVDHALDGLITIDARGMVESFNPACERIFGYQADEVIGHNIKMLMPEPYHSGHDGYLQRYQETGKAAIIGTTGREVSAKRKNGSIFPMDLAISAFQLEGQQHFSGILRDITHRKQAEAELLRYTRELEHSNQELDDFAYIASHDLKEPLRGLFNHASFLLEDYQSKLDQEGVHRLNRLSQLAQRMEQLVNDLLYFSRLGRADLAIQTIDPNHIIRDIEQMMESFLKERNVRIIMPTPMPSMVCDKIRITEVFRNLITNAAKYNDKPDRFVEVGFLPSAAAPHRPEKNVFYVRDNGIGIEPEFHQEIFRIFKRLGKEDGGEKGTGVGLTFVKKIVERHRGHIWLESKLGEGTTFFFNINQGEKIS